MITLLTAAVTIQVQVQVHVQVQVMVPLTVDLKKIRDKEKMIIIGVKGISFYKGYWLRQYNDEVINK